MTPLTDLLGPRLPSEPTFDLAVEPWIAVTAPDGSAPRRAGLREVLRLAHELRFDTGVYGPMHAHAMIRWTTAMAYVLHHHRPDPQAWKRISAAAAPLPTANTDELLDRLAGHLWLHHPTTPFMQDLTVLDHMASKAHTDPARQLDDATHPYWTLLPDIPSKSNAAWFNRSEDLPAPGHTDIANHLLTNHYWSLPGNLAPNSGAGGKTSVGGPTGMTNNGRTYVHLDAGTVAATMAANLEATIAAALPNRPTFFWEDPGGLFQHHDDPLWAYTASGVSVVLVPAPHDPAGHRVVRTPRPYSRTRSAKDSRDSQADVLKERMIAGDPHTLRTDSSTKGQTRSYPRLFATTPVGLARLFHSKIRDLAALHEPCLLRRHAQIAVSGQQRVVITQVEGAGSSTGPLVKDAATIRVDPSMLELQSWQAARFIAYANALLRTKGAVGVQLSNALGRVAGTTRPDWVYDHAHEQITGVAEQVLEGCLIACHAATSQEELPNLFPEKDQTDLRAAALAAFDQTAIRLGSGPRHTARTVEQCSRLGVALAKHLANPVA